MKTIIEMQNYIDHYMVGDINIHDLRTEVVNLLEMIDSELESRAEEVMKSE